MPKFLRLTTIVLVATFLGSLDASAANWYVRKGATGSNNGTNWTNAWNEMNQINFSTVACGDTIWLAGGTYTTSFGAGKTCTAGNVLTINRVLATDSVPVAAAGWSSAFDAQVIITNGGITMGGAYWTVDGRIGTPTSNNMGISMPQSGGNYAIQLPNGASANHLTFSHIEVFGPACVTAQNCTSDTHALDFRNFSGTGSFITIDHCWFHRESELLWLGAGNVNNIVIQYTQIDTSATTTDEHADIMYAGGTITNLTFAYDRIFGSDNDGMLYESGGVYNGQYFYGNVFYSNMGQTLSYKGGSTFTNVYLYNNVFQWDGSYSFPSGQNDRSFLYWSQGSTPSSGAAENNVFEGVTNSGGWGGMTVDYNAYSSDIGKQDSGTHSFVYTKAGQFVNEPNKSNPSAADFHLTATGATAFQKGVALGSPYNKDPDGNTRGSDGNWYIGAYQYGTQASAPQAPTGVTATVQ
jgi:hypothetical protein